MRTTLSALAPLTKRALALLLDLFTSFVGFGYLVGFATGVVAQEEIALTPAGAAITFALMLGYFGFFAWAGGGTPWQRVLVGEQAGAKA